MDRQVYKNQRQFQNVYGLNATILGEWNADKWYYLAGFDKVPAK